MWYKKIGGLHWLAIGRLRLAWCVKAKPPARAPHPLDNTIRLPAYVVRR